MACQTIAEDAVAGNAVSYGSVQPCDVCKGEAVCDVAIGVLSEEPHERCYAAVRATDQDADLRRLPAMRLATIHCVRIDMWRKESGHRNLTAAC